MSRVNFDKQYQYCFVYKQSLKMYNAFNVYRRELAPGTVSLTGDRAQGDDSKHWAYFSFKCKYNSISVKPSRERERERERERGSNLLSHIIIITLIMTSYSPSS